MKTIPKFIRNADAIVASCEKLSLSRLFKPRTGDDEHTGFLPNIPSRFKTLKNEDMPDYLIDLIFDPENQWDEETRNFWSFIQIQKYDIGDYIVPHRDAYFVKKLHLVTLTYSHIDGLVCANDKNELIFYNDMPGQYVDFPYDAIHFVAPVKDKTRYSIVIGI